MQKVHRKMANSTRRVLGFVLGGDRGCWISHFAFILVKIPDRTLFLTEVKILNFYSFNIEMNPFPEYPLKYHKTS